MYRQRGNFGGRGGNGGSYNRYNRSSGGRHYNRGGNNPNSSNNRFKTSNTNNTTTKYKNVIPFDPEYDESKLTKVKYTKSTTTGGVTEKTSVEIPKLSEDCSHFELLKFIKEFNEARQQMEWNAAEKLNQKLREVLSSSHKDNWDVIVNQYKDENATEDENGNITAAPFNEEVFFTLLDTFIAEFFGENDYKNQVKFLRNAKKPPSMTPTRFKQLFDIHNGLLKYFAHAPIDAGFTEEEAKDILEQGTHLRYHCLVSSEFL